MITTAYPNVRIMSKDYDDVDEMYGEYIANDILRADKYRADSSNELMLGEIQYTIGDRSFSLYDKVIYENEEYSEDAYIYNENVEETEPVSPDTSNDAAVETTAISGNNKLIEQLYECKDSSFLLKNFYIIDRTTSVKKGNFNVEKMLKKNFTIKKSPEPQILIYHTHGASESFKDSKKDDVNDGIVGVGDYLTEVLTNQYGYNVYHDRTCYDLIEGKIDRSLAYAKALPAISGILRDNPSIKVIIDLHRDGVGKDVQTTADINGVKMAQVMLFNGLSRNSKGAIKYLHNDNLNDNLAFSLQMKLKAMQTYPNLTKPIYLKGYRYNLHLLPRSLLIELGSQNNTVEEAKNAIPPLADVLNRVLMGE